MNTMGSRPSQPSLLPAQNLPRDDRVLPLTRWVAAFIIPVLIIAFVILYLLPNDTGRYFAWTIKPHMTSFIMGAGYIAGAYFFLRVFTTARWHEVALGFLPITAFTTFMLIATILHWDRFNHAHISFLAWVVLYVITPVLIPYLWWRNTVADPQVIAADDVRVPAQVRQILGIAGAMLLAIAVFLLLFPAIMISVWPWTVTPLTARVIGGWFALPSVVALMMAREPRWSAIRTTLESQLIGLALILLGVVRAWSDFGRSPVATLGFVGGITLLFIGLLAFYVNMQQRPRTVNAPV